MTIVDRWIFDASLPHALPLCSESLDTCCSTKDVHVSFKCVMKAVRYQPVA